MTNILVVSQWISHRAIKFAATLLFCFALASMANANVMTDSVASFANVNSTILDPDEPRATSDVVAFVLDFGRGVDWLGSDVASFVLTIDVTSDYSTALFGDSIGIFTSIDTLALGFGSHVLTSAMPAADTHLIQFALDVSPDAQWQRVNLVVLNTIAGLSLASPDFGVSYSDFAPSMNRYGDVVSVDLLNYFDANTIKQYLANTDGLIGMYNFDDSSINRVDARIETVPEPSSVKLIMVSFSALQLTRILRRKYLHA